MASVFEQMASLEPQIVDTTKNSKQSPFQLLAQQEPPPEESFWKSSLRTALQIPQGILEGTKYGITTGLQQLLGMGEALDPEEMDRIKAISEREGIPFDEQGYLESTQNALGTIPTISNIASQVEKRTGIPLEPKTRVQKGLRFASVASKLAPKDYTFRGMNTSLPRPVLGTGIEGSKEILQETGIPEPLAELASFGVIQPTSAGAGKISIGRETKPSGLTTRQYEKLKNPKEVSGSSIQRINEKTEKEFRDITNKIIEDSPIKETYESLKNDVIFKQNSAKAFEDVQALSESIPNQFETQMLKQQLVDSVLSKKNRGVTPSEFDIAHKNFITKMLKDTPDRKIMTSDLVAQYRKNNRQLSEAYEPGQSFAYNRAKREALLDYNRTIASIFEKEFPNTEFTNLFKETNKRWSEISDAEAIDKFLDGMFKGKIQYQKGRQFFDKQGMTIPFKRAMGEEGFAKFETLMKDLMSTEQASKLLKEAKSKGFGDLAQTAGAYILHPNLAKGKLAITTLKGAYNTIFSMVLDKPQLAVTWDRGINAMKSGNFKTAQKEFNKIRAAEQSFEADKVIKGEVLPKPPQKLPEHKQVSNKELKRREALKKFNDKRK